MAVDPRTGMVTKVSLGIPDWLKVKGNMAGTGAQISKPVADAIAQADKTFKGPEVYKPLIDPATGNSNMDVTGFAPGKKMAITDIATGTANATAGIAPPIITRPPIHYQKGSLGVVPPVSPAVAPSKAIAPVTRQSAPVARKAPVLNTGTKPAVTKATVEPIAGASNDGLQTPGYQVPGETGITRLDNVAPDQFNSDFGPQGVAGYNVPIGGGIASNGDETFVLRGRTPGEETAYQAQQARWKADQPGIAQAPQQTSTVGYGNGIETFGADGNMISSTRKLDSTASVGDLMMEKFNTNQQAKRAGINNVNSEITSRNNKDGIAAVSLPLDLAEKSATIRNKNFATDSGIALHPLVIQDTKSITANRDSEKAMREKLSPVQLKNYESEIKAREASTRREDLMAPALATKHLADAAESSAKLNLILSGKGTGAGDKEDARFFYDMAKGMAEGTMPMTPQMAAFLKSKGLYQPPAK